MRKLHLLWLILSSGLAFGQAKDIPLGGVDQNFEAGNIELSNGQELPIKFRYQYGLVPEIKQADPEKLRKLAEQIYDQQTRLAEAHQIRVLQLEGEAPTVLPVELTERFDVIDVPVSKPALKGFRKFWNDVAVKPSTSDYTMASIFAVTKATITYQVLFGPSGLDPTYAAASLVSGTLLTFGLNAYNKTFSNVFTYNMKPDASGNYSKRQKNLVFGRQGLFDQGISNFMNLMAGMSNSLGQNIWSTFISGVSSNLFGVQKNLLFKGRSHLNVGVALVTSPIMFALQASQATGHSHVLFEHWGLQINQPMVEATGYYLLMGSFAALAPEKFIKVAEVIERNFTKVVLYTTQKISYHSNKFCDFLMNNDELPPPLNP